jgi:hypothetical protein
VSIFFLDKSNKIIYYSKSNTLSGGLKTLLIYIYGVSPTDRIGIIDFVVNAIRKTTNNKADGLLKETQIVEIEAKCHKLSDLMNELEPSRRPLIVVERNASLGMLTYDIVDKLRKDLPSSYEVIGH